MGGSEINFRAKFAVGILQPEPKRAGAVPIHQQQIVAPVAVDVQDLHRLDRAGEGNLLRLAQRMVGQLRQEINIVLAQQNQIRPFVAIEVAGGQGVGRQLAVVNRPAFRRAPVVAAQVVDAPPIPSGPRNKPGPACRRRSSPPPPARNSLLRGDGFDAKTRIGRQLVDFLFHPGGVGDMLVLPVWL
jgi:hypothetical protein